MEASKRVQVLSFCASAAAATIATKTFAVTNQSFESPVTTGYIDDGSGTINNPSNASFWGWGYFFSNTSVDHDAGVQVNTNAGVSNAADNSPQNGWVNGAGNYLYQDLGALAANTTYVVTVAVAAPGGSAYGGVGSGNVPPTDEVDFLNGTNTVSGTINNIATNGTLLIGSGVITPTAGAFQDVTVSYTTGSTVSNDLILQLMEDTAGAHEQGVFDDVRLTVNGVVAAPQWSPNASGDWNVGTNWSTGVVPNAVGAEADFLGAITTAHTIYSDIPVTVGTIVFNNANSYVLAGTGPLTLQATGTAAAQVAVQGGGIQKITLPLIIASNTTFNVASGSTLVISAPTTIDTGDTLKQTGTGTVSYQSTVTVQTGGTFAIASSSYAHSLTLAGTSVAQITAHTGSSPTVLELDSLSLGSTSVLDLANNDLIINDGSIATLTSQVAQGFNGGKWNGLAGIVSTTAAGNATHLTALGVIQNSVDGTTTGTALYTSFEGQTVSDTAVLAKYTYYGDTNLDGKVDGSDYSRIDNGYLAHASGWFNGDFNYDGVVNGSDYTLIDNAYNRQGAVISADVASPTAQIAGSSGTSSVPEPTTLSLLGMGTIGLLGRRRKHS